MWLNLYSNSSSNTPDTLIANLANVQFSDILTSYQEIELSLAGNRIVQRLAKPLGNKVEVIIPKSVESAGYVELIIKVNRPMSPRTLGIANDDRRLGVGLVSAVFK